MIYSILSIMTMLLSLLLGAFVYLNNRENRINKTFVFLILSTMLWIFSNFMTDTSTDADRILFWSKITILGPVLFGYFFYKLTLIFPRVQVSNKLFEKINLGLVVFFVILSPTSLNIKDVYLPENQIPAIIPGSLYISFSIYFVYIIVLSFTYLFGKYKEYDRFEKLQVQYISIGLVLSAVLGSITNLILPVFGNSEFVNFGPYFVLILITFISIAVIKFKLFDIKIITTQLLVFSLWIFIFLRTIIADTFQDQIINGVLLVLLLIFGTLLIKSVISEVNQREKIEKLALDLKKANTRLLELDKQKSEFVSFATHQLRAPLTAMKGYSSLIMEGEYGQISNDVKKAIGTIYESAKTLTNIVNDYLNISRIELGSMKYSFEMIDLKEMVKNVISELKPNIDKSGLSVSFTTEPAGAHERFMIHADRDKFKQVIGNLVDNSVKYTPKGSLEVHLVKNTIDRKITFTIKDTGVGIAPEVMPKLFSKFTRAENANKQNIYGTGLGLYVAKEIVESHKGKIWAESDGEGLGATFYLEMDMEM